VQLSRTVQTKRHVLVVDDEARIREVVQYALERDGFAVSVAGDGARALELAEEGDVDLVVLDIMLPELDGLEVCRRLRAKGHLPILFLSARSEELDRVLGLELGGDDYLTKPFSPRELVARVRAVLRRTTSSDDAPPPPAHDAVVHGKLQLDAQRHEARFDGELVTLTATELGLLLALFERPGVVLSRGQLMQRAYAYDNLVTERTIDTHVRRIRGKFRRFDYDPIATVYGVGYKAADA
jgi:two-component system OmpR family response regulator